MAAVADVPSNLQNSEEIVKEVRNFIKGSTFETKVPSEELARSALFLLRSLPSARQAVLEYLCNVFDEAVNTHILQIELGNKVTGTEGADLNAVIEDVKAVMMGFVKSNPDAWAPVISAWSIELLGQISSRYAGRRAVPHSSSLNELLQLWMTCSATSVLIEIASECFASMVGSAPDVCVSALLEASVKHSPHFDWVVAHIGSCFPTTIITRVLMCGLKDFYLHGSSQSESAMSEGEKVPKLASVVGILGHLAAQHGPDIRKAILTLFQESLCENVEDMQLATVPFLLHLASMSRLLLRIITLDFVNTVSPSVLNRLAQQFAQRKSMGAEEKASLGNLLVHLISKSDVASYRVLMFLLDNSIPHSHSENAMDTGVVPLVSVQETCCTVMERLLLEIQRQVHCRPNPEMPFLSTLQGHTQQLCQHLVQASGKRHEWLAKLLCSLAVQGGESPAANILCGILKEGSESSQLGVFVRVQQDAQAFHSDIMAATTLSIAEELSKHQPSVTTGALLRNLLRLSKWESRQETRTQGRNSIREALHGCLTCITPHLYSSDTDVAAVAMELLAVVGMPRKLSMDSLTKLCCATAAFFFQCLLSKESMVKCQNVHMCRTFMEELSGNVAGQGMMMRFLLEGMLSKEHAPVFGSKVEVTLPNEQTEKPVAELFESNQKKVLSAGVQPGCSTVFHGGIIGRGLKPVPRPSPFSQEEQVCNRHLLVDVLWACCTQNYSNNGQPPGAATADPETPPPPPRGSPHLTPSETCISHTTGRALALLLIELVAPDVMYNGILWLEEDFMKVTVERDLQIRKKFDDNPVLWDVMEVLSNSGGAMCYCSALLRGVAATLIVQWDSCRDKVASHAAKHLHSSQQLMECLRKGALMPAPLCHVGELFPYLSPFEVCLLLQTVWRYMKENPPVPDPKENLLRGCDRRYTDLIQSILHNNIDKLGHTFTRFLPRPPGLPQTDNQ